MARKLTEDSVAFKILSKEPKEICELDIDPEVFLFFLLFFLSFFLS